jgi:hypothetical protein
MKRELHTALCYRSQTILVPVVYDSMDTLPIVNPAERLNICDALENKHLIFGRESDLLLLEKQIAAGYRTIFLRGPYGIGKMKFIISALGWWTNTGLAVCHHFRTEAYITQLELLKVQAEDALRSWQESTLSQEGQSCAYSSLRIFKTSARPQRQHCHRISDSSNDCFGNCAPSTESVRSSSPLASYHGQRILPMHCTSWVH